jgi:hypothetical protein
LTRGAPGRVGFATTPERARTGSAAVVLASGALEQVRAERTPFCSDLVLRVELGVSGLLRGRGMFGPVGRSRGSG